MWLTLFFVQFVNGMLRVKSIGGVPFGRWSGADAALAAAAERNRLKGRQISFHSFGFAAQNLRQAFLQFVLESKWIQAGFLFP